MSEPDDSQATAAATPWFPGCPDMEAFAAFAVLLGTIPVERPGSPRAVAAPHSLVAMLPYMARHAARIDLTDADWWPLLTPRVSCIVVTNTSNVRRVPNDFLDVRRGGLSSLVAVTHLDLSRLTSVRFVGHNAFAGIDAPHVDLDGLRSVESIGDGFLEESSVERVDLSQLPRLRTIGHSFLRGCEALLDVHFGSGSVCEIGDHFLQETFALGAVTTAGLEGLKRVPHGFLFRSAVRAVDLGGLRNVTSVGADFMSGTAVTHVSLAPLARVDSIGSGFMHSSDVRALDLTPLAAATEVDVHFLEMCGRLGSVGLGQLPEEHVLRSAVALTGLHAHAN